jgi:hypothetical protein
MRLLERVEMIEEEHGQDPAPGSQALAELTHLEARVTGEWFQSPVASVHAVGDLAFASAVEHLEALALAVDSKTLVLSVFTLARAGLEAAARAWWIFDTSIDGLERLGRGLTELLYGWRQSVKIGPPLADRDELRARTRKVVEGATSRGLPLLPNKDSTAAPELGERRPPATELVRQVLEHSTDAEAGKQLFQVYSAIAHGTVPALVALFTKGSEQDEYGRVTGRFYLEPTLAVSILGFSILGFDAAFRRRVLFNGWADSSFDNYRKRFTTSMEAVLRSIRERDDQRNEGDET